MSKYILGHKAQARAELIRYLAYTGCLLLLVGVLQTSVLARLRPFGAVPDLMLCTVLCLSFFGGRYMGGITGIAGGFLIDAMGAPIKLSLLPLCLFLLGYLVGYYAHVLNASGFLSYLVYLGAALPLRIMITTTYAYLQYGSVNFWQLLLYTLLPETILTAAIGCALYAPMLLFFRVLEKRKRR